MALTKPIILNETGERIADGIDLIAEYIHKGEEKYELIENIIIGYSVLTSQPGDWASNWNAYYKNTGTDREPVYENIGGSSAPTWQSGKYYSYSVDDVRIVFRNQEPDGTPYDFKKLAVFYKVIDPDESQSAAYVMYNINGANANDEGQRIGLAQAGFSNRATILLKAERVAPGYIDAQHMSNLYPWGTWTVYGKPVLGDTIFSFRFNNYNASQPAFSSGSTVTVYAVR